LTKSYRNGISFFISIEEEEKVKDITHPLVNDNTVFYFDRPTQHYNIIWKPINNIYEDSLIEKKDLVVKRLSHSNFKYISYVEKGFIYLRNDEIEKKSYLEILELNENNIDDSINLGNVCFSVSKID